MSKTNPEGRCRGSVPTAITSTLEPFPTCIVTSSLANLRLIRSPCFELQIWATEPVSNTQALLRALVRYTSITCISNIPFTLSSFLSAKYLGQFRFQWPVPLQWKHSVSGLGPDLGFFTWAATCLLFFLKFPFFPLPFFLKLVVLLNRQYLMLLLDFYLLRS